MAIKVGRKYKVYEDPITKKKLEGIAKVIFYDEEMSSALESGYYHCCVRFDGVGESRVGRKVCEHDIVDVYSS
jgi:hypothetical protein